MKTVMSKFHVYNIQLLPLHEGVGEVGRKGYRKLFSKLRDLNNAHRKAKTRETFHWSLPGNVLFGPYSFNFAAGFVYGTFVKYTQAENVTDLDTRAVIFERTTKRAAVRSETQCSFVFDTDRHLLAIDSAVLPKPLVFVEILEHFFGAVAAPEFPGHSLSVNLVSQPGALEQVLSEATAYKNVNVTLAFPNSHSTEELLDELQENQTRTLHVEASAGKGGWMSGLPQFLISALKAAPSHGFAVIRYVTGGNEAERSTIQTYDSRDVPLAFTVRHSANDSEGDFYTRAAARLAELPIGNSDGAVDTEQQG